MACRCCAGRPVEAARRQWYHTVACRRPPTAIDPPSAGTVRLPRNHAAYGAEYRRKHQSRRPPPNAGRPGSDASLSVGIVMLFDHAQSTCAGVVARQPAGRTAAPKLPGPPHHLVTTGPNGLRHEYESLRRRNQREHTKSPAPSYGRSRASAVSPPNWPFPRTRRAGSAVSLSAEAEAG